MSLPKDAVTVKDYVLFGLAVLQSIVCCFLLLLLKEWWIQTWFFLIGFLTLAHWESGLTLFRVAVLSLIYWTLTAIMHCVYKVAEASVESDHSTRIP